GRNQGHKWALVAGSSYWEATAPPLSFDAALPRGFGHLARPAHHVLLKVVLRHLILGELDAPAHRDAGGVHGVRIARHQRMPPVEVAPLRQEPVGAGRRQPGNLPDIARRELDAVRDLLTPARIIAAAAGLRVEQPAADVGEHGVAGVDVLELVEAAAPAAVAQALPLGARHLRELLAPPERRLVIHARGVARMAARREGDQKAAP